MYARTRHRARRSLADEIGGASGGGCGTCGSKPMTARQKTGNCGTLSVSENGDENGNGNGNGDENGGGVSGITMFAILAAVVAAGVVFTMGGD